MQLDGQLVTDKRQLGKLNVNFYYSVTLKVTVQLLIQGSKKCGFVFHSYLLVYAFCVLYTLISAVVVANHFICILIRLHKPCQNCMQLYEIAIAIQLVKYQPYYIITHLLLQLIFVASLAFQLIYTQQLLDYYSLWFIFGSFQRIYHYHFFHFLINHDICRAILMVCLMQFIYQLDFHLDYKHIQWHM